MDAESRERQLANMFVALADTLTADYDVVDLLDRLTGACVELFEATAAGLMLTDQRGSLRVMASSSEKTRLLELFQLQNDDGPCLDCFHTGVPVSVLDLAAEADRWPIFAPRALAVGFRSVHARPMRLRDQTIGAFNLFHTEARALPEADLAAAQALADVATIGILSQRAIHRGEVVTEQLQLALNSRIAIEQAKGVLAELGRIDMEEAFIRLRGYARSNNHRLSDLARDIVQGRVVPAAVLAQPRTPQRTT
jgi:transcriptional regulator with GAF, ATPase, and Fis domain